MKGFVFAAGFGERLRPITDGLAKPLVPVVNLPAVCWPLALLRRAGVGDVLCNLHYRHNDIIDFFRERDGFDFNVMFSYEREILGTGGGLKKCEKTLRGGDFVALNGDVLMDLDIEALMRAHRESSAEATVVLYRHPDAGAIGPVGVEGDAVVDFRNHLGTGRDSGLIYTGAAALSPGIFERLEKGFSSIVYTAYIDIIRKARLHYYIHEGYWHDVGTPFELHRVNMKFLDRLPLLEEQVGEPLCLEVEAVSGEASIHPRANVVHSVVGAGASVAGNARVTDSVLFPGARVGKGMIVEGALVAGDLIMDMKGS